MQILWAVAYSSVAAKLLRRVTSLAKPSVVYSIGVASCTRGPPVPPWAPMTGSRLNQGYYLDKRVLLLLSSSLFLHHTFYVINMLSPGGMMLSSLWVFCSLLYHPEEEELPAVAASIPPLPCFFLWF